MQIKLRARVFILIAMSLFIYSPVIGSSTTNSDAFAAFSDILLLRTTWFVVANNTCISIPADVSPLCQHRTKSVLQLRFIVWTYQVVYVSDIYFRYRFISFGIFDWIRNQYSCTSFVHSIGSVFIYHFQYNKFYTPYLFYFRRPIVVYEQKLSIH